MSITSTPSTPPSSDADADADADVGVERAEEFAREHPGLVRFGRVGWVAKGLVYGLTGILSLVIAVGSSSGSGSESGDDEASQSGAIARLAESPAGGTVLYVVAAGLVLYALWRLVSLALPADNGLSAWLNRAGYAVSAIAYLGLAWTAFSFALNPGSSSEGEDSRVERYTRDLMDATGGRVLVVLVGVGLVVIAGVFLWKAIDASFTSQLLPGSVGPFSQQAIVVLGRVGWTGRAGMMAIIGFFLARAAIRFDPDDAQGLDGSLRKAASSGLGTTLVIIVGAGLLVYGIFCVVSAPKRRLVGADS